MFDILWILIIFANDLMSFAKGIGCPSPYGTYNYNIQPNNNDWIYFNENANSNTDPEMLQSATEIEFEELLGYDRKAWIGSKDWVSYTYSVNVTFTSAMSGDAGILFDVDYLWSSENGAYAMYFAIGNGNAIVGHFNGTWNLIESVSDDNITGVNISYGNTYKLTVTLSSDKSYYVWVNGADVYNGSTQLNGRGSVGLRSWQRGVKYSDFEINNICAPSASPTISPTLMPTNAPSGNPTESPTNSPTVSPTNNPTLEPTPYPTDSPTPNPTNAPSYSPTGSPTNAPIPAPTNVPSSSPTPYPTNSPTPSPTNAHGAEYMVASSNAYVSATEKGSNTQFNAPRDGVIMGIYFEYINGGVSCNINDELNNFGCDNYNFSIYLYKVINPIGVLVSKLYPNDDTFDIINYNNYYIFNDNKLINITSYELRGNIYSVSTSETFILIFGDTNNGNNYNNIGNVNILVKFIYLPELDPYEMYASLMACVSGPYRHENTLFNAPKDGYLTEIKLIYIHGGISCESPESLTNWGCYSYHYQIYLYKITDVINRLGIQYYPIDGSTTGMYYGDEYELGIESDFYYYEPYSAVTSNSIGFGLKGPGYNVYTTDVFALMHAESAMNDNTDIHGTVCAAVIFSYAPFEPTTEPTNSPTTSSPTKVTNEPTKTPTNNPTTTPTMHPTLIPSLSPSITPTVFPTVNPSIPPTISPSLMPTLTPSESPTKSPTMPPSLSPSKRPTASPSVTPSVSPTIQTVSPTLMPTKPTVLPTHSPTNSPTVPTNMPTVAPTQETMQPTIEPTMITMSPTMEPTVTPTNFPTMEPTINPTHNPSALPTKSPTSFPTTTPTEGPTKSPSMKPSVSPTLKPTIVTPPINYDSYIDIFIELCNVNDASVINELFEIFINMDEIKPLCNKGNDNIECKLINTQNTQNNCNNNIISSDANRILYYDNNINGYNMNIQIISKDNIYQSELLQLKEKNDNNPSVLKNLFENDLKLASYDNIIVKDIGLNKIDNETPLTKSKNTETFNSWSNEYWYIIIIASILLILIIIGIINNNKKSSNKNDETNPIGMERINDNDTSTGYSDDKPSYDEFAESDELHIINNEFN